MWLDAIGSILVLTFVLAGAWRGTVASAMWIVSLVVSYGAAILFAPQLARRFADLLRVPELLGMAVGGSVAFFLAYLVMAIAGTIVRNWDRVRRAQHGRSITDRLGGAFIGATYAAVIIVLLGILGSWIEAGRSQGLLANIPETKNSWVMDLSQDMIEHSVAAMVGTTDPTTRVAVQLLTEPDTAMESAQRVLEDPRIRILQNDRLFWNYVRTGAIDRAVNQGSFLGVAHDSNLRQKFKELGVVDEEALADPSEFKRVTKTVLRQIAPRLKGLENDPVFTELAQDPYAQTAIQERDTLTLIRHPAFRKLIDRWMRSPDNDEI